MNQHHLFLAGLILSLMLGPQHLAIDRKQSFVVWNVGQGQWATLATNITCQHFDMGGERMDWRGLKELCSDKDNRVYFSHWDWDHIGLVGKALRELKGRLCIAGYPGGSPSSERKQELLLKVPTCGAGPSSESLKKLNLHSARNKNRSSSNTSSEIFVARHQILLPGDSPSKAERMWLRDFKPNDRIQILVLGHHGSRTSTSIQLLNALTDLKMGIASQRTKRYGHPHAQVVARLKEHGVPVLKTEDWGNLHVLVEEKQTANASVRRLKGSQLPSRERRNLD